VLGAYPQRAFVFAAPRHRSLWGRRISLSARLSGLSRCPSVSPVRSSLLTPTVAPHNRPRSYVRVVAGSHAIHRSVSGHPLKFVTPLNGARLFTFLDAKPTFHGTIGFGVSAAEPAIPRIAASHVVRVRPIVAVNKRPAFLAQYAFQNQVCHVTHHFAPFTICRTPFLVMRVVP
jgi:hypothetical protein